MAVATALKALAGGRAAKNPLVLYHFPEYVTESEKLRRIAADFNAASALLKEIDDRRLAMTKILAKAVDDRARAIVDGKQEPIRTVLESDRAKINHDVASLRAAMTMQ